MFRLHLLFFIFLAHVSTAHAFYISENNGITQETRGLLLVGTGVADSDSTDILSARLMYDMDVNNLHVEYQQIWLQTFATADTYQTKADRLSLSYSSESMHIKLGRQAISLATTFFFSPNDFFSPFTIQSLNRDYKQGVDALYSEVQLGELSQLSAILVNNQDEDIDTSSVLRFESAFRDISWMVLAGEINQPFALSQQVFGGSMQTDIFDSLGIRAEGHVSTQNNQQTMEWAVGLEKRLTPNIILSGEWFHHGAATTSPHLPYIGKQYLALGLNYQITPLVLANLSIIRNIDDQSQLNTAYINYSLSDESTLNLSILLPTGTAVSEFGFYPEVYVLDYQLYF